MNRRLKSRLGLLCCGPVLALPAYGQTYIGGNQIAPSTSLVSFGGFTINQIADGITSDAPPYNGFASTSASGIITLDLNQPYSLGSFILWNDINVLSEGIGRFRLDFFDVGLTSLGSTPIFQGPIGQIAPATYSFAAVSGVKRVNLVVIDSNVGVATEIEIREVGFLSPVPEPTSLTLFAFGFGAIVIRRLASAVKNS